jgi:hypothetical protein
MKTFVTIRKYTFILGLLFIAMFDDLTLMYDDPKAEFLMQFLFPPTMWLQIYAYKTHFGCMNTKIRSGVDMKPNLLMKCRYFCFYEIYLVQL